jgi:hypothetical protein
LQLRRELSGLLFNPSNPPENSQIREILQYTLSLHVN